jgi:hypothetical protein
MNNRQGDPNPLPLKAAVQKRFGNAPAKPPRKATRQ